MTDSEIKEIMAEDIPSLSTSEETGHTSGVETDTCTDAESRKENSVPRRANSVLTKSQRPRMLATDTKSQAATTARLAGSSNKLSSRTAASTASTRKPATGTPSHKTSSSIETKTSSTTRAPRASTSSSHAPSPTKSATSTIIARKPATSVSSQTGPRLTTKTSSAVTARPPLKTLASSRGLSTTRTGNSSIAPEPKKRSSIFNRSTSKNDSSVPTLLNPQTKEIEDLKTRLRDSEMLVESLTEQIDVANLRVIELTTHVDNKLNDVEEQQQRLIEKHEQALEKLRHDHAIEHTYLQSQLDQATNVSTSPTLEIRAEGMTAVEALKIDHDAQIKALEADHAVALENLKVEQASIVHDAVLAEMTSEIVALKESLTSVETELAATTAALEALKLEHDTKTKELQERASSDAIEHVTALEAAKVALQAEHELMLGALKTSHAEELANVCADGEAITAQHNADIAELNTKHESSLAEIQARLDDALNINIGLETTHKQALDALTADHTEALESAKLKLVAEHTATLEALGAMHTEALIKQEADLTIDHETVIEGLKTVHEKELENLIEAHNLALSNTQTQLDVVTAAQVSLETTHREALEAQTVAHVEALEGAKKALIEGNNATLEALKVSHAEALASANSELALAHARELDELKTTHESVLADAQSKLDAALAEKTELEEMHKNTLEAEHASHLDKLGIAKSALLQEHEATLKAANDMHVESLAGSISELTSAHAKEIEELTVGHASALADLTSQLETSRTAHSEVENAHKEVLVKIEALEAEFTNLSTIHQADKSSLEALSAEFAEYKAIAETAKTDLTTTRAELDATKAKQEEDTKALMAAVDDVAKVNKELVEAQEALSLTKAENKAQDAALAALQENCDELAKNHNEAIATIENHKSATELDIAGYKDRIETLEATHREELEAVQEQAQDTSAVDAVKDELAAEKAAREKDATSHATELSNMVAEHDVALELLRSKNLDNEEKIKALSTMQAQAQAAFDTAEQTSTSETAMIKEELTIEKRAHADTRASFLNKVDVSELTALKEQLEMQKSMFVELTAELSAEKNKFTVEVDALRNEVQETKTKYLAAQSTFEQESKTATEEHLVTKAKLEKLEAEYETTISATKATAESDYSEMYASMTKLVEEANAKASEHETNLKIKDAENAELKGLLSIQNNNDSDSFTAALPSITKVKEDTLQISDLAKELDQQDLAMKKSITELKSLN